MDPTQKLRRTRGPGQDSNPGSHANQFLISLPLSKMCGTPKKVPKVSASLGKTVQAIVDNHVKSGPELSTGCLSGCRAGKETKKPGSTITNPTPRRTWRNKQSFASSADLAMENEIAFCGRNCVGGPGSIDIRCLS